MMKTKFEQTMKCKLLNLSKYTLLPILLLVLPCSEIHAQKLLNGRIVDYFTNQAVTDMPIEVVLLDKDSVFVDSARIRHDQDMQSGKTITTYCFIVRQEGDYIMKCTHRRYKTEYVAQHVKFYKRETIIKGEDIRLKRTIDKEVEMGEVTVTATRLKFYFHNDTLVYDASTFSTQYGLVLNDLLRKMPGVTIDDAHNIYSNGRKINELLLNGKNFFNSDRETLLENLPSYMVKNVKIYEHADSIEMFKRQNRKPPLAMDIKLKPEYNSTFLGNVDVAGGIPKRYFARALVMRIHDLYRITAFAGSNNTNHNENADISGKIYNMDNGSGDKRFHVGGLNYNVDDRDEKYRLDGSFRIQGSDELQTVRKVIQTYYKSGDLFTYSSSNTDSRNFSIQTSHNFNLFPRDAYSLTISPSFSYVHTNVGMDKATFTSNKNITEFAGANWADSIRTRPLAKSLLMYGISRVANQSKVPASTLQASLKVNQSYRIPHTKDLLTFELWGTYANQTSKATEFYGVDYITPTTQPDIAKYLYNHVENSAWQCGGKASYSWNISEKHRLAFDAGYERQQTSLDNQLHNLTSPDNWGMSTEEALEMLPSQVLLMNTLDRNSFNYKTYDNLYTFGLNYTLHFGHHDLTFSFPFKYHGRTLDYKQENNNQIVRRNMFAPDIEVRLMKWMMMNKGFGYVVSFKMNRFMPAMINLVDRCFDVHEQTAIYGNPDLNDPTTFQMNATVNYIPKPMQNHSFFVNYNIHKDAIGTAVTYDRSKDHYKTMPMNIDGNQDFVTGLTNAIYLDKQFRHKLTNKFNYTYIRSADFFGETTSGGAQKRIVHNNVVSESLEYAFMSRNTKYRGSAMPFVNYHRSVSDRENFTPVNAFTFGVKLTAQIEVLNWFRLNTELQTDCRRGYNDSQMNDNEVVWNIGVVRSFNNHITLSLNAVDILNQRKSVYRVVTAQGSTEQVTNMLPRHVMLHFIWQFSTKKTKR